MEGVKSEEQVGLGRLLTGMAFVIFAITLVPGMFGGKLGEPMLRTGSLGIERLGVHPPSSPG